HRLEVADVFRDHGVPAPSVRQPTVRTPVGGQLGKAGSPRGPELGGCRETLRRIMAPMPQWAQCSPTSRRILRHETGSDPRGQHGAKYGAQEPSRGRKEGSPLGQSGPSTLRPIRYRRFSHGWGWDPALLNSSMGQL